MAKDVDTEVNDELINDIFNAKSTVHAEDAVDYEDEDELAEEELDNFDLPPAIKADDEELELQQQADDDFDNIFGDDDDLEGNLGDNPLMGGELEGINDMDDMNIDEMYGDKELEEELSKKRKLQEEQKAIKRQRLLAKIQILESRQVKRNLKYHYPDFSHTKPFNNHKLFLPPPKYYKYQVPPIAYKPKPLVPKISLEVDIDQRKVFKTGKKPSNYNGYLSDKNITYVTEEDLKVIETIEKNGSLNIKQRKLLPYLNTYGNDDKFNDFSKDLILALADWDDDKIINAEPVKNITMEELEDDNSYEDDEDILNGTLKFDKIKLDMNDPNLLFESTKLKPKTTVNSLVPLNEKLLTSRFNLSNDKQYEIFQSNYNVKVRSQISNLNIEHSVPALRLQSPFYKVKLTKQECRGFHRSKFNPKVGLTINFSKIKPRKRKKDKGKTSKEIFSRTSDLTIGDNSVFIGFEYAEEYPMILSNYGMGSKLINYYRRTRPDDNSRPKNNIGETHVLGVEDRSPFWNYGHVDKGDLVPTLYNNMIRAPIFKQEIKLTDFVLIRSQGGGGGNTMNGINHSSSHPKYFLKKMDHLFNVGHIFPSVEVPAPQSRKVTNTSKNRLKMIVYRTMNKNGKPRISVKDISHHFPDQNDMQNRQRLKEFMEYQRSGEDQGYWKIKAGEVVPDEESIRSMITPEDVTLLDAMQSSQQLVNDLTILLNEEQEKKKAKIQELDKDKDGEEDSKERRKREKLLEMEEGIDDQLTSWNLSRNFVLSNQTKSMLQLIGEGDPSGIGIGFSFLKTSSKTAFTPLFPPPKENVPKSSQAAYQQRLYDNEVSRIWYAQRKSLHNAKNLPQIYHKYKPVNHNAYLSKKYEEANSDLTKNNKFLRISRRFKDHNGIVQRKVEIIKDPRIIKSYLKRKKEIEDNLIKSANLEDIVPTDDAELNELRRKALQKRLANAEKQIKQHKPKKSLSSTNLNGSGVTLPDGSVGVQGKGIGKGKSTARKCTNCGAVGHIKTNKACPLFSQTQGGTIDIKQVEA